MLRMPATTRFASSFGSQNSLSSPPTISSTAVLSLEKQTELARGALNFVRENYFGNEKNRKAAIEKAKRDDAVFINSDGETEYCLNRDVLHAIRQTLTLAEDIETLALIFDNALRYGYQQELAVLIENCCADFLTSKEDAGKRQALAGRLKVRSVKLSIDNRDGTFRLAEISADPLDRGFLETTKNELNELGVPMVVGAVIGQYQEQMSFEMALLLTSAWVRKKLQGRDVPNVTSFLKEKFEAGVIDSDYIQNLSAASPATLNLFARPGPNMQAILKKYGTDFFLGLGLVGLQIIALEINIQLRMLQGDITLSDLQAIDKIATTKCMTFWEVGAACDFSSSAAIKAWIAKNS